MYVSYIIMNETSFPLSIYEPKRETSPQLNMGWVGGGHVHQCRDALPGGEKSRVFAAVLPITEGLRGQFCLTALTIVLKMLLITYHCDDRLAV